MLKFRDGVHFMGTPAGDRDNNINALYEKCIHLEIRLRLCLKVPWNALKHAVLFYVLTSF